MVLVTDNCIQVNIYILTVAFTTAPSEEIGISGKELGPGECSSSNDVPQAVPTPLSHRLALPSLSWLTPQCSLRMRDLAAQEKHLLSLQTT